MTRYLKARPSPSYTKVEPLTLEEIDEQINSDRIWATIVAIRQEAQEDWTAAYWAGYEEGRDG